MCGVKGPRTVVIRGVVTSDDDEFREEIKVTSETNEEIEAIAERMVAEHYFIESWFEEVS